MSKNDNTYGCIGIIIFIGSLYISITTHIPLFGYLMIFVFVLIFLLMIFDIFSSPTKIPQKNKEISKTKDINNDNFNSSKFSKTNNQTVRHTKNSITNAITWIFIIFCFVTCVSRHRVGAICNDGTSSNATSSGACSHHNGVNNWKYEYWWD